MSENNRLKAKTADMEAERDVLTKRLTEKETVLSISEDAKQAVETQIEELKLKSEASIAMLQRRVEAQAKVGLFTNQFLLNVKRMLTDDRDMRGEIRLIMLPEGSDGGPS